MFSKASEGLKMKVAQLVSINKSQRTITTLSRSILAIEVRKERPGKTAIVIQP